MEGKCFPPEMRRVSDECRSVVSDAVEVPFRQKEMGVICHWLLDIRDLSFGHGPDYRPVASDDVCRFQTGNSTTERLVAHQRLRKNDPGSDRNERRKADEER